MRYLIDSRFMDEMNSRNHSHDCYVRGKEYLHHMYMGGMKCVVVPALLRCLEEAQQRKDAEALAHLGLHKRHFDQLASAVDPQQLNQMPALGDPPPSQEPLDTISANKFLPPAPQTLEETGLNKTEIQNLVLRTIFFLGRATGIELVSRTKLIYPILEPLLRELRDSELIAVTGQQGTGDFGWQYELRPPRGQRAAEDALNKTTYIGPAPVPLAYYEKSVLEQTIRNLTVNRRNIREAFQDLIITEEVLNEVGPAINSASSLFLFGYPGNGKTSIAERISRLMGSDLFIPYAIEVDGQIISLYDPVVHRITEKSKMPMYDGRWAKIERPTVIVGGELTLPMLDLSYNDRGKFYEAPLQLKANGGAFLIDDFGRQQVRPGDLLNRWIIPLEKHYDYMSTITGTKFQVPFEQFLIFSTNLDPTELADEAFLRRIKFKIEVRDPDVNQWVQIWDLVCKKHKVELDHAGLEYMIAKWFKPYNRNFRMCQPRDVLDKMISIAEYNMESLSFSPDLIDAACSATFIDMEQKRTFGAAVKMNK